jgi:hypothetical protein
MPHPTYDLSLPAAAIVRETEKAVCFLAGSREVWIPRRHLGWREHGRCFAPTAEVPFWFAARNGLISTARNPGF